MKIASPLPITTPLSFEEHLARCGDLPPSIMEFKKNAWVEFLSTPSPSINDEKWRFSTIFKTSLDTFSLPTLHSPLPPLEVESLIFKSTHVPSATSKLIFCDNACIHSSALPKDLQQKGVIFEPLSTALIKYPDLILKHFKPQDEQMGCKKHLMLHAAYLQNGYLLYVPPSLKINAPFVAYHWTNSHQTSIFPSTIIIGEDHSQFSIVDIYLSTTTTNSAFSCGYSSLHLGSGANVFRKSVQNFNPHTLSFQIDHNVVAANTTLKSLCIHLGSLSSRTESQISLNGPESQVDMYSLSLASQEQAFDQRTLQIHNAPHTRSNLLYKNALFDNAQTIFSGLIKVAPQAQKTDAYQKNKNLLLSPNVKAHSLPGLEIEANDVKCSHGATSGEIDKSELYYMLSRGVTKEKAKELLIFGFFSEVINMVDDNDLLLSLQKTLEDKFQHISTPPLEKKLSIPT